MLAESWIGMLFLRKYSGILDTGENESILLLRKKVGS
jgi:hypothetical protein